MAKTITTHFMVANLLLLTFGFNAHGRTCGEHLKRVHDQMALLFGLAPVVGWAVGLVAISDQIRLLHDSKRLHAATVIAMGIGLKEDITAANAVITEFYAKLVGRHQKMTMGKKEVINILHKLDMNGVQNGFCLRVRSYGLANSLFPDDKAKSYLDLEEKWQQDNDAVFEQEIEAAKIRNAKNANDHDSWGD